MRKDLLHPIFLKCVEMSDKLYWRNILEDMAYGRCPYGLYIKKNYLCSFIKGRECSYFIDNDKPIEEFYREVIEDVLKQRIGLRSPEERDLHKERFMIRKTQIMDLRKEEWNHIRKKMVRDILFEQFILRQATIFLLSMNVCRRVLCLISIGVLLKTIQNQDIKYKDGYVHNINGFHFSLRRCSVKKEILCPTIMMSHKCIPFNGDILREHKMNGKTNNVPKNMSSFWVDYVQEISSIVSHS